MKVLIDDDEMIQIGWKLKAKKCGVELQCFGSVKMFLDNANEIPISATVYVDSHLGNDLKGEVLSEEIFKRGFTHIILTTGYDQDDFDLDKYFWIKGIIPKTPPF